ncbi:late competence development ComFB family protein [Desulfohalovibrio reitneri]|uniref:late competence development ComFB family protein n=1 Tax=Desulfohalovibrio reitneri TaxID=1307759 RepID=UPI0004A749D5|nr:late competence development ComFB family protein [Desulfohalovibrio reitneri]
MEDIELLCGKCVSKVRNKNEQRVARLMPGVIREVLGDAPDPLDVEDIYALCLNNLRPRYVQTGSIVLREPVDDEDILDELRRAATQVRKHPKHGQKQPAD